MTKARTRAQARRDKAARAERDPISAIVDREESGRRQRPSVSERLRDNPSGWKRAERAGHEATPEARERACRDPRLSTLPGCLNAAGRLADVALEGLLAYAIAAADWWAAEGMPGKLPGAANFVHKIRGNPGDVTDEMVDRIRRKARAYEPAADMLTRANLKALVTWAFSAPEDVGVKQVNKAQSDALEKAGFLLAEHYGIG